MSILPELQSRLMTARKDLGYKSRSTFCKDRTFNIMLRKFKCLKKGQNLTPRQLKYIEIENQKIDTNFVLAFCYRFKLSFGKFCNSDESKHKQDLFLRAYLNKIEKQKKKKWKTGFSEKLIAENRGFKKSILNGNHKYGVVYFFTENAYLLTTEKDDQSVFEQVYSDFEFALKQGLFPNLVLEYIIQTLRNVANRCYLNRPICPDFLLKTTKELRKEISINRGFCEKLVKLIGAYHTRCQFEDIDFSALDLRRLHFYNKRKSHYENNLRNACFKGANIAYCVLSGLDLTNVDFDDIVCAKNTYFFGSDTLLKDASFENANLKGVNRRYDDFGRGKFFVYIRQDLEKYSEEQLNKLFSYPFYDAGSFDGAWLDDWLDYELFGYEYKNVE